MIKEKIVFREARDTLGSEHRAVLLVAGGHGWSHTGVVFTSDALYI